jgi:exonuclease III
MTQIPLSLISLNANGLGEINKRRSIIGWLKKFHNADSKIVFLQEIHTTEKSESLWTGKDEWNNKEIYFAHGDSGSAGVAIVLPKLMDYKVNMVNRSKNGRYIAMDITIEDIDYCIINCYAPNTNKPKDQLKWLEEINTILENNENKNIIIGGDLNDVFNPLLDRYRCKPRAVETDYVKTWKMICDEFNLADFWRVINPNIRRYTWRQGSSATTLKQSRLDYWLVSMHMM